MAAGGDAAEVPAAKPWGVGTPTRPHARGTLIYQAAIALPEDNRVAATDRLRGQLRIMASAAGATPDWRTLAVIGPVEMPGSEAGTRFEWTARVAFLGGIVLEAFPDPCMLPARPNADDTVPLTAEPGGD